MRRAPAFAVAVLVLAAGCGSVEEHGGPADRADDSVARAIADARASLATPRIVSARHVASRLRVRLAAAAGDGEATISLWYGKLLAQSVVNRAGGRISSAAYTPSANGGPDRRLRAVPQPRALDAGACRRAADSFTLAQVTSVQQIDVLGGACLYVLRPADARGFVADAGAAVAPLRDLPGGPNAHATLVDVIDDSGSKFVLWWIPDFGGTIGQGAAWVQPGWESSALVGQMVRTPLTDGR